MHEGDAHCCHGVDVHSDSYDKDLQNWKVQLGVAIPLTLILMFVPHPHWLGIFLALPVYLFSGFPFLKGMILSLWRRHPDMNALVGIGATAAFFARYFDTTAMLITFLLIGRMLEARTKRAASRSLRFLYTSMPQMAHCLKEKEMEEVPVGKLQPGDLILIRPGEIVPADGVVMDGMSAINESLMTGEPLPNLKRYGDTVYAGTHNLDGSVTVRVQKKEGETFLSQIQKMTEEALTNKAPLEKMADKISSIFVPIVLILSLITFLGWFYWGNLHYFASALQFAISVLIIACPCALGLATPVAVMAGLARGATEGILIKGGDVLEKVSRLKTVVLDKTGTITEGRPKVKQVLLPEPPVCNADEVLRLAAMVGKYSEHLLARAVVEAAQRNQLELESVSQFKSYPGLGSKALWNGKTIFVGSSHFLSENEIPFSKMGDRVQEEREKGGTIVFVALDQTLFGAIVLTDEVKSRAQEAVQKIKGMGLTIWMITGDQKATAEGVAEELGITKVLASMRPDEKVKIIDQLKKEGAGVAMVGDGINDAMALAAADVGIAYASGSDLAKVASDITLVRNDALGIVDAIHLAKKTYRTILQNLWLSFAYNILAIPIAAGVFYPSFGLKLSPEIAAIAMSLSSVSVVLNSLRLRRA